MEKNPIKQITKKELQQYIISEAMKMLNAGDAMEVDMNTMDKEVGSDGKPGTALVKTKEKGGFEKKSEAPAKAENIVDTEEATEVKMNQNAKEGGSDEKISAAVAVISPTCEILVIVILSATSASVTSVPPTL